MPSTAFAQTEQLQTNPSATLRPSSEEARPLSHDRFWSQWRAGSFERWEVVVVHKLLMLASLAQGWDGYGAIPMKLETGMFACNVLANALRPTTPIPQIVPTADGGVQLEWHERGVDLELTINSPYNCTLFHVDHSRSEVRTTEQDITNDFSKFEQLLTDLSNRG